MSFKIGIISWCEGKSIAKIISYFKEKKLKENIILTGDFEVTAVKACFMGKVTAKKLEKARIKLIKKGCDIVLKDINLRNEAEKWELYTNECKVFLKTALKLYMEYIKLLELKAYKMKLLIVDKNCLSVNMDIIDTICFYSSRCDIRTDNIKRAEYMCTAVYEKSGFVMSALSGEEQKNYDVIIDVDHKTLKITGKVFIDTFDLGFLNIPGIVLSTFEMLKIFEDTGGKVLYRNTAGNAARLFIRKKEC